METIKIQVINAVNELIADQRQIDASTSFSLALFNHSVSMPCESIPIEQVPPLTAETYAPSGGTALNDAVALMVQSISRRATSLSRVLIAIVTDGSENSSRQFMADDLRQMIRSRQRSRDWQFIFIGPLPAFSYAREIGIPDRNIAELDSDIGLLMNRLSKTIGAYLLGDPRYALRLKDRT
jgi:hypothetical protein